jgi:hypothetical protein
MYWLFGYIFYCLQNNVANIFCLWFTTEFNNMHKIESSYKYYTEKSMHHRAAVTETYAANYKKLSIQKKI